MRWYAALAVFIIALAGTAVPAAAQSVRPLDQILPQIRSTHPGTFYDAEGPFRGPDGRMHYRLKWMTPSGRIIWLDTDAHTGRVLGRERSPRDRDWRQDERSPRRYVPGHAPRNDWRQDRRWDTRGRDNRRRDDSNWRQRDRRDRDDRGHHRGRHKHNW
jgi:hypothetical protein